VKTDTPSDAGLQLDRAEFDTPTDLVCTTCGVPIGETYFTANSKVLCPRCRDRLAAEQEEGGGVGRVIKAAVLGLFAAGVGAGVWYAVREVTHLEIGLIAIVVGLVVGGAVRHGAGGRGGRGYQVLAVLLTYVAIVSANAPYVWNGMKQGLAEQVAERMNEQTPGSTLTADSAEVRSRVDEFMGQLSADAWAEIAWVVARSPFLEGPSNIIGWLIIFFGLQQAWSIAGATAVEVAGPFSVANRPTT
jgi:hypothetical protein